MKFNMRVMELHSDYVEGALRGEAGGGKKEKKK